MKTITSNPDPLENGPANDPGQKGSDRPGDVQVSLHLIASTELTMEQAQQKAVELVKLLESKGFLLNPEAGDDAVEIRGYGSSGEWEARFRLGWVK
jgi:hypothetical protein